MGAKQSLCRFSKRLKFKMPTALPCFHLTFGSKGLGFVPLDHGNAVISVQFTNNPVTHLSSYLFPATVLTERCRGDDGTSLKSSVMSAVRL